MRMLALALAAFFAVASAQPLPGSQTASSAAITTQNLAGNTGVGTPNSYLAVTSAGLGGISIQITGTWTGMLMTQVSNDNVTWVTRADGALYNAADGTLQSAIPSGANGIWQIPAYGTQRFRIVAMSPITGSAMVTVRATQSAGSVSINNFPAAASSPTSGTVAVSNFPATQPVSGTVAVSNWPGAGLTDAQLRATPVAVSASGTVSVSNFPAPVTSVSVSNLPATQPVSGTVTVANPQSSVSVSNFPATQPVSVASMPTTPVTGTFWQATQPVSGTFWQATQPVSIAGTLSVNSPLAPSTQWQASSGLTALAATTSTAVKAAAGAGLRNYVSGCQLFNTSALTPAVVTLLDGATVIWAGYAPALPLVPLVVTFPTPLRTTANTALNLQLSALGSVYWNCQGFTGA